MWLDCKLHSAELIWLDVELFARRTSIKPMGMRLKAYVLHQSHPCCVVRARQTSTPEPTGTISR